MDPARGVCRGCGRTLDEIAGWASMSDADRERVMQRLPERMRALDVAKIAVPPFS